MTLDATSNLLVGTTNNYSVGATNWVMSKSGYVFAADNTGSANNRNWIISPNGSGAGNLDFVDSATNTGWPNNAYRMILTASGNLGLGVTPSAWGTSGAVFKSIEYGRAGNAIAGISSGSSMDVMANAYYNGGLGGWIYANTGSPALRTSLNGDVAGAFTWNTAPSGTAGNAISFTQAMTLDASGNLLVGTTSAVSKITSSAGAADGSIGYAGSFHANQGAGGDSSIQLGGNRSGGLASGAVSIINAKNAFGNGQLCLYTEGTERARITSGGDLLVGTTSSVINTAHSFKATGTTSAFWAGAFQHEGTTSSGRVQALILPNTSDADSYFIYAVNSTGNAFNVYGNGNVQNTNNSYGAISDVKLKENIVDASPKLDKLNQVRIVNYNLKNQPEQKLLGVVAQELEQVFPGMVDESPDRDKEGNDLGTTTKSVKYSVFVPMLIKAIQEQQALITTLTERLDALEAK
jgi:hypothetical protein